MENNVNPYGTSYVEWSAIIAGAVLASAFTLVLVQFGSAIGMADLETLRDPEVVVTPAKFIGMGLFILIVQVLASMIGGYTAGRMRATVPGSTAHESEIRDGMHGVLAWATATLAVVASVAVVSLITGLAAEPTATTDVARSQELIDREHTITILLAFAAASTSLVSAAASWIAAVAAGDHRDRQVDYARHVTFLVRR